MTLDKDMDRACMTNREKYLLEREEVAALRIKISRLEAALRRIAVGLTEEDNVADYHNRYQMCAGRLCKIARDALRATVEPPIPTSGSGNNP